MRLNARMHYGLKAMIELARNNSEKGLLQREIAERQCMPYKFMDSVIRDLKTAGLITNVSGKKSGYKLVKKPEDINVYDIYRSFCPDLAVHHCVSDENSCSECEHCASHAFFSYINLEMINLMKSRTLKQLADLQISLLQLQAVS